MRKCVGRWIRCLAPALFCLFASVQVHAKPPAARSGPLPVFVSIPPQLDTVKRIGGRYVRVKALTVAGRSPCHYEPTPAQVAELTRAGVYFTLDVPFERKLLPKLRALAPALRIVDTRAGTAARATGPAHAASPGANLTFQVHPHGAGAVQRQLGDMPSTSQDVQTNMGEHSPSLGLGARQQEAAKLGAKKQGDPPLVRLFGKGDQGDKKADQNALSTPLPSSFQNVQANKKEHEHRHEHRHEHEHGHSPPHVWLDPYLVLGQAKVVRDTLIASDPAHRHVYMANWEKLSRELTALDQRVTAMLQPVRGRAFLVLHPAWESFAAAYGLKQIVVPTGKAGLSANRLARTIEMAKQRKVRAVIVGSAAQQQRARVLARDLKVPVARIDPADPELGKDYVRGFEQLARKMKAALSRRP